MGKLDKEKLENVSGGAFIIPDSITPTKPGVIIKDIKATHMGEEEKNITGVIDTIAKSRLAPVDPDEKKKASDLIF